ncbi:MAG TPA: DUF308 domain-containing protein [Sphingomicrobium sp.]|jgi:uncharacterized membrane protein HdeD (DUF308 family)|nr:DUF308 domain-containing protein [Sphingomicrobium sp.]
MATTLAGEAAGRLWGWILARGILALILGILALIWPLGTLFAFTMLFAAYAFVDGLASLVAGLRSGSSGGRRTGLVLQGILGIAVGVIFVAMPLVSTFTYAWLTIVLLAFWSVLSGILEIAAAIRLRKEIKGEFLMFLSGLFSLLLGCAIVYFVVRNPAVTILSAAWLIAIYALAAGIVLVILALRLRSLAK